MVNQKESSEKKPESKSRIIERKLSTLWINEKYFTDSDKRIIFRFYALSPDLLTLHGWSNDGDVNDETPDFILTNTTVISTISFGNKTYFGNLVLRKAHRKDISKRIKSEGFKYVLFIPNDPTDGDYPPMPPGQITYNIALTNDDPEAEGVVFTSTQTYLSLNPCPPRNPG